MDKHVEAVMRRAFTVSKANAKRRGIPFILSFNDWVLVWVKSSRWSTRGRRKGQYQMDRIDNLLGYTTANVQVVSGQVNRTKDSPHGWKPKLTEEAVRDIRSNMRKGVTGRTYFAAKYGVSVAAVKAVTSRRNWSSIL